MAVICLGVAAILALHHFPVSAEVDHYSIVKERLVKDGFDRAWIDQVYGASGVQFEAKGITSYFTHCYHNSFTNRNNNPNRYSLYYTYTF